MTAGKPDMASRPLRGIILMIAGISLLATLDVLIKIVSQDYGVVQTIFLRSLLSLPVLLLLVPFEGGFKALKTQKPLMHASRGLVMAITACCFVYSFQKLPLSDAYALIFSSPLMLTLLAIPLLGERVGKHRAAAVAIGFIGVLIAMRPGFVAFDVATYVALTGALGYALVLIFIRQMSKTETSIAITFYGTIVLTVLSGLVLPWFWQTPTAWHLLLFIGTGIIGGLGQYCLTLAFRHASASLLAPYEYLSLIWGAIYGYFIFQDVPGIHTIAGSMVIVASGLYIIHRERMKHQDETLIAVGSDPVIMPIDMTETDAETNHKAPPKA